MAAAPYDPRHKVHEFKLHYAIIIAHKGQLLIVLVQNKILPEDMFRCFKLFGHPEFEVQAQGRVYKDHATITIQVNAEEGPALWLQ